VAAADGGNLGLPISICTNRGKRSIELDFETRGRPRIVRKLAARSDILIENFKVGGLAKFASTIRASLPSIRASSIAR